ncbi:DUF3102 domain-containing protein [Burkholderia stagnalis]|uniref:DUF3102 domain-containing protein n=1 Tax=Burkholderia stagnalis TaxID=1503054 RepID=UPI000F5C9046|nr:DUF3102 domain-containing protein [Burkholderia stagnalis]RQY11147.1 DUF3102 domain-containing protein [Burkholderia stagnalis]RQY88980.1 DUF3102 domain-containing protein [Burkholderia stagnalis]RQY96675.1 DUF3102 domain-containing protein [Burkholderia stagnalis]
MGRKAQESTAIAADNTLEVLPALTDAANKLAARSSEISKQFGDGLPYERHRVVNEARFYMAQSAEAMLEAGKRLILLKENEPHGEFTSIVEEQLGLAPRTARLMIQAAVKYSSPQLESKRQALAVLGKTKLFELMTEDDEELAALADGGTIAGMDLDDIDRMTSRELRAALREAHENATAQSRLLSDKNAKIDELAAKKTRVKRVTPDQEGAEIRKETSAIAFEAESVIRGNLRSAFESLAQHAETNGAPHDDFMAGVLGQIQLSLNQLRSEFGVKAAADGEDVPQWLRDTSAGTGADDYSRAAI